jgi:hypothetical protein
MTDLHSSQRGPRPRTSKTITDAPFIRARDLFPL